MGTGEEGLAEGKGDVQNGEMGAGDEGLAEGEGDVVKFKMRIWGLMKRGWLRVKVMFKMRRWGLVKRGWLRVKMPTQTSSSFVTPPNDAEYVQTSVSYNIARTPKCAAYRPPRLQNVPAYRPPRPQNVPQPSAQNVNQRPSQASTCSQTKAPPKASRKQKVLVYLSSKLEKRKVSESSSQDAFKRQCCPPKKSSISSVLKGVADSYRPRTQASGSSSTGHSPGN
ncbi:hypothetical protein Salat_0730400 [Sesamum alatum]|uniref:Uncharacterized protein n=1 Tax=Sesamum alatum TaxID=300844 RepID=A0AAE1YSX2_9LAMI|nr:hypothetical protein Salat_0730400 [Sesamum alatum]